MKEIQIRVNVFDCTENVCNSLQITNRTKVKGNKKIILEKGLDKQGIFS